MYRARSMPSPPPSPLLGRDRNGSESRIYSACVAGTPERQGKRVQALEVEPAGSDRRLGSRGRRPIPEDVELPNQC